MTRKQVEYVIENNPNKALYVLCGGSFITFHEPISKTRALRLARHFHSVRYGTYNEQRPDLSARYKIIGGEQQIVTFDALDKPAQPRIWCGWGDHW